MISSHAWSFVINKALEERNARILYDLSFKPSPANNYSRLEISFLVSFKNQLADVNRWPGEWNVTEALLRCFWKQDILSDALASAASLAVPLSISEIFDVSIFTFSALVYI